MKTLFIALNNQILRIEKILLGLSLASMIILLSSGVIFRYVLNNPLVWTESVAKLLIVWMTFLGTSIAFSEKSHIRVDSLVEYLPFHIKTLTIKFVGFFTLLTLSYMAYLGYVYFKTTLLSTSPILGISIGFFSFGMPILFSFSIFHIFVNSILDLKTSERKQTC